MGVFLSLDESDRIVLVRFEGILTDKVLLERYEQARAWFHIHGDRSAISFFGDVVAFEVTVQGVSQLAASPPLVPNGYLRIVVAPQNEIFGMTRMFGVLGNETRDRVHVVRTMAEACQLVGVESIVFHPVLPW
jgi:hypothetical protein